MNSASNHRYNIYSNIHKTLRAFMGDTLNRTARMDGDDAADTRAVLAQIRQLLAFCRGHLQHENEFIHTAMEARQPGASRAIHDEHLHHIDAIGQLESLCADVERSDGLARALEINRLHSQLAVFVGDNLLHMHVEETEHNAVLWASHTDQELLAIEHAIVASIPPEESMFSLRWMIPALNPAERAAMFAGMRAGMPPPVFEGVRELARQVLSESDNAKLSRALNGPVTLAA